MSSCRREFSAEVYDALVAACRSRLLGRWRALDLAVAADGACARLAAGARLLDACRRPVRLVIVVEVNLDRRLLPLPARRARRRSDGWALVVVVERDDAAAGSADV